MRRGVVVAVVLALNSVLPARAHDGISAGAGSHTDLPDVAQPHIDDAISEAELEDLTFLAEQNGMSLQAAIDRYAWNDNFALAVADLREADPSALAGAAIVDGGSAWVAFAADAPELAKDIIFAFERAHTGVAVEVRPDFGFAEREMEQAIEAVHYSVLESAGVRNASTSFDSESRRITTIVSIDSDEAALDDLRARAADSLGTVGLGHLSQTISVAVVESALPTLGGRDDGTAHIGGEAITTCTTGFVVRTAAGVRGVGTAGHCQNAQSDDGVALAQQGAGHEGANGDFQWHTGPQGEPDDFYAGDAGSAEVARRDVAGIGAPVVGQALCKNGKAGFRDCGEVIQLNVCSGAVCNLVQMDARRATGGDSGGPVYWNYTAYGFHQGWRYDPAWPFDRDLFSRADRIDNALGVNVANN